MIDIGANLTDKSFSHDVVEVIRRAVASHVERIVVTGTNERTSYRALEIAMANPEHLSCTAGVHPHDADRVSDNYLATMTSLARQGAVAIGETGLDYFRHFSSKENQRNVFSAQLELAEELQLPVFVHDRDSDGDVLSILQQHQGIDVVVHCFTGGGALLDAYLGIGCYIGITGWVCDERRGTELAGIVDRIPDNRLMLETDSPYLMPRNINPRPSSRRNEPKNLVYVRQKVAELRRQTEEHVDRITTANAMRFFRFDKFE